MSSATRHLCRTIIRISSCPPAKRQCQRTQQLSVQRPPGQARIRCFTTTRNRCADEKKEEVLAPEFKDDELQTPQTPYTVADLDAEERATYETMSKKEQERYMALQNHFKAVFESEENLSVLDEVAERTAREIDREGRGLDFTEKRDVLALRDGFWQEDEDDEFGQVPDGDDDVSDDLMSSIAESELQVHREIREYQRLAAWDLPLLSKFVKPYEPPSKSTPLRFRYTTYLGETHPAAKKVVCEFDVDDICAAASPPLNAAHRLKLLKLAGPRYNPSQNSIKISCEKYEEAAQNKRYLGDLVSNLLKQAQDETDMFEDVPLDLRHHKPKFTPKMPPEWFAVPQNKTSFLEKRAEVKLLGEQEKVVDGREVVEMFVRARNMAPSVTRSR